MRYIRLIVVIIILQCIHVHCGKRGKYVSLKQRLSADDIQVLEDDTQVLEDDTEVRLRGGIRQRLSNFDDSDTVATNAEPLVKSLRSDWAHGKITSSQLQHYAAGAQAQGADGMNNLATAGSSGRNLHRSLMQEFSNAPGAPDVVWGEIPTLTSPRTSHPFLLPHEFLQSMFLNNKRAWDRLGATSDGALEFWKHIRLSSFVRLHPKLQQRSWSQTIPIGMHGDGGAFSKNDALYIFSWNSLLAVGSTETKRIMFTVVRKSELVNGVGGTFDAIWKIFAWSLNAMLDGMTPSVDWLDRPIPGGNEVLAGGWKATLCQCRGDWEFYWQVFNFPRWNSADSICWLCKASASDKHKELLWTDCGADAGWRCTRWTHESYLDRKSVV